MASSSASVSPALRRLQQDYQQLLKCPVPNIIASPIEGNLFSWAVNMVASEGVWVGLVVHLHMEFPPTYPKDPPTVDLKTDLSGHPNVFGTWICLDMLKDPGMYSRPYQGWSSAYTLSSILTQLCGFLLVDDSISQMGGGDYKVTRQKLRQGSGERRCTCSFHDLPPLPLPAPEPQPDADPAALVGSVLQAAGVAACSSGPEPGSSGSVGVGSLAAQMERLDSHLVRSVLANLGPKDLHHCLQLGGQMGRMAADVLQRSELICFHSKLDYTKALLGFGINRAWHRDNRSLRGLSAKADYLSWQAFQEGVRKSAWNCSFDAFLPLYLNPEHGKRTLAELPHFTRAIVTSSCTTGRLQASDRRAGTDAPELLHVLGMLINSLVVEMVGGAVQSSGPAKRRARTPYDGYSSDEDFSPPQIHEISRAMSDSALQAFCHMHHLLLAVALQPDSKVTNLARKHVSEFIRYPDARGKGRCPDLGVLLVEFLLVPREEATWEDFAPLFIREALARQVLWAIRDVGNWFGQPGTEAASFAGDSADDTKRMTTHFESGKVGLRLMMLQAWFANALARPSSAASMQEELAAIKASYDEASGLPPARTFNAFNAHARSVMKCSSWVQVLSALRLGFRPTPGQRAPRALFAAILRQSVLDSWKAGYHRAPAPVLRVTQQDGGFMDWERQKPLGVTSHVWV